MVRLWRIATWPLVVKVPVLVAGLMVTVAVTTSQVVLWRFAQNENTNLGLLTGAYLDGLSKAVLPALVRRDSRALFDPLDRGQGDQYARVEPRYAILEKPYALPDLLERIARLTASRRPRNVSAYHARRCSRRCASSIYAPSLTPDLVRTGGRAERRRLIITNNVKQLTLA
jgi:hypothetical protein